MKRTNTIRNIILILLLPFATAQGQDLQYARNIVNILASDSLMGRGYVKNGHRMAADYIEHEFEKTGLQPLGRNFTFTFRQEVNTFPGKVELAINDTALVPGKDYLIAPFSPSLKGSFDLVNVDKKLLLNTNQLKSVLQDVNNKVLVINERDFNAGSDYMNKKAEEILNVIKFNTQIPHVATMVLTDEKLTWHMATTQAAKPVIIVNTDKQTDLTGQVKIHIDAALSAHKMVNIAGMIKGHEKPDSFLMFTAHYDHLGMLGPETIFNGANDNASGVAMLLSLARYFAGNPPAYSMVFVALAAEELGLLGAKAFVDDPPVKLQQVKFLVNFDLAGTGDEGIMVVNGSVFKDELLRLQEINEEEKYLEAVKLRGEACISDHCIFYQAGVPSFYIYTLGGISAYHDIYDRPETLPLTEFEDYARLMIDFAEGF